MSSTPAIITINRNNLADYPDYVCFINAKHPAHSLKKEWVEKRLSEGLRIKLLYVPGQKKAAGFIEYIPGENAWRAVSAKGFLFIQCLYIYPNANKNKGLGSLLISDCIEDAKQNNLTGVAVVTSSKSFMAGNELFLKNGFSVAETDSAGNDLLIYKLKNGPDPVMNDFKKKLSKYQGLFILYSKQCPWVARMVEEIKESGMAEKLNLQITELKTPNEAQQAPSLYATFNLICNGKLLADRYISLTRFNNILKKEKLI
jgi:ribosomal protein S18 acetylase RimI-like enzyme